MDGDPFNAGGRAVPSHVAIIMDGNGRWATARGLPRAEGHRRGAEAVRRTVKAAAEFGISWLTLFSFSSENWSRPTQEVDQLMDLLRLYLRSELAELHGNGVRMHVIGERSRLPDDIVRLIEQAERTTAQNTRISVVLALSYGSRQEIAAAARALALDAAAGRIDPASIDAEMLAGHLDTAGIPDPDLLIRTSGEQRISNFLLWQLAYTEFVFANKLWPDFDRDDLAGAIEEFQRRDRRYGASVDSL